jgi:3',5'-cyclic-nucleotide phosphodiesterase
MALPFLGPTASVQFLPLAHSSLQSSAFLITVRGWSLLYLGDTGPDAVEGGDHLLHLWHTIAPSLIRNDTQPNGRLRAIMIECSFSDPRDDTQLYGHMTPSWIMKEMTVLANTVASLTNAAVNTALNGLTVIIIHIKPLLTTGTTAHDTISSQLKSLNTLGINFVLPSNSQRLLL